MGTELVVIAFILLYFVLFFVFYRLQMRPIAKKRAKKILAQQKAIHSEPSERVEVSPRQFPWLDESYYDEVSREMTDTGFRHLVDYESINFSKQFPGMRTFLRCFVGDGDTIMAGAYQIKIRGLAGILAFLNRRPRDMRTIDLTTELDDQTFLVTVNNAGLDPFTDVPGFVHQQLDPDASLEQLLSRHREQLRAVLEESVVRPIRISTKEEMFASQERAHKLISRYRQRIGYITREQFAAIAGGKLKGRSLLLAEEFEKAREEDHGRCLHCGYLLCGLPEPRCPECGSPVDGTTRARASASVTFLVFACVLCALGTLGPWVLALAFNKVLVMQFPLMLLVGVGIDTCVFVLALVAYLREKRRDMFPVRTVILRGLLLVSALGVFFGVRYYLAFR